MVHTKARRMIFNILLSSIKKIYQIFLKTAWEAFKFVNSAGYFADTVVSVFSDIFQVYVLLYRGMRERWEGRRSRWGLPQ